MLLRVFLILMLAVSTFDAQGSTDLSICEALPNVPNQETGGAPRRSKKFILDPNLIQKLSCRARIHLEESISRGVPRDEVYPQVIAKFYDELRDHYPRYITTKPSWFFNIAGGALVQMTVATCNLAEYLILFSSPVGTEGYSGQYKAELWDFVLDGQIRDYALGTFTSKSYPPGSYTYMKPGDSQGFKLNANTLVVEYARGKIIPSVKFGILANKKNLGRKETKAQVKECARIWFETSKGRKKLRQKNRQKKD